MGAACSTRGKHGKRPLRRLMHKWEENIKIDLTKMWFGDVDWINLAQNRNFVTAYYEHSNESWKSTKYGVFFDKFKVLVSHEGLLHGVGVLGCQYTSRYDKE